ncbi:TPA: hypothetical protein R1R57_000891 [Pseudomonas aeruginosa]|nr:hypothetical protein [Pseudomonas aeruginosa]HEC0590719.1 hypothetical protein [Pseudomonas aeruginosa]HEC0959333.1 hypothetical protein [Pseudomonas aeruginosa]HEC1329723.1 hypothetical protein [Pseudomonas aeruginosa]HEC1335531.1 hypothetical protein [Pseudomonas aeruginosa]
MKKHLFLATAVLAAPLLAHADLKAMDDGALSDVTGQAGISISGTFQGVARREIWRGFAQ